MPATVCVCIRSCFIRRRRRGAKKLRARWISSPRIKTCGRYFYWLSCKREAWSLRTTHGFGPAYPLRANIRSAWSRRNTADDCADRRDGNDVLSTWAADDTTGPIYICISNRIRGWINDSRCLDEIQLRVSPSVMKREARRRQVLASNYLRLFATARSTAIQASLTALLHRRTFFLMTYLTDVTN